MGFKCKGLCQKEKIKTTSGHKMGPNSSKCRVCNVIIPHSKDMIRCYCCNSILAKKRSRHNNLLVVESTLVRY